MGNSIDKKVVKTWLSESPLIRLYEKLVEENKDKKKVDLECPNCLAKALEPADFRERLWGHIDYHCNRCGYSS